MGRKLRGLYAGQLVEVTQRTLQARFLLAPSPIVNATIKGVLARAQQRYEMKICAGTFLSNHFHLLLLPDSTRQLSSFMRYVSSNIARKVGKLQRWEGRFWARRYQAIIVSQEERAQVARLRYILAHGVKEGLVATPEDWPGVQFVSELSRGRLEIHGGQWTNQSALYRAGLRGQKPSRQEFTERLEIHLEPLPCWEGISRRDLPGNIKLLVQSILEDARTERVDSGKPPLGVKRVLAQNPHDQPIKAKKEPAPHFHVASKDAYRELLEAYRLFVASFREAADLLALGVLVSFPEDCFPPPLPPSGLRAGPGP